MENNTEMGSLSKKIKAEDRTGADDEIEKSDNEESDGGEKDEVKKLLKPFSAGQVFDILCDAAMKDANLLDNIRKLADKNLPHKKVFIDGLHSKTTEETLYSIFSQYGELEECTVVMDDDFERSEGCAFVTYKQLDGAEKALKYPCKKIDSRRTLSRLASDEQEQAQAESVDLSQKNVRRRKILVSNVPVYISCLKLINHFSLYGEIEEGQLGFDRKSGKLKAYVVFTYKNVEGAKKALEEPDKNVCGHYMHCTRVAKKHKLKEDGQNVPGDRSGWAVTHGKGLIMGPDTFGVPHPDWFDDSEFDMGYSNLASDASSSQHHAKALQLYPSFPELAKGASSSHHHAKLGQWKMDAQLQAFFLQKRAKSPQLPDPPVPWQAFMEAEPVAGLNTHSYGKFPGIKHDYSSHAAHQWQDFYQDQQLTQVAAPDLPDLNAHEYIYDSQATKDEKNATQNQQFSLSTLQDLLELEPEPITHQMEEMGLEAFNQTQHYQQPAFQFEQVSVEAIHQTQQDQQPAYQFEQPSVQAIHQAQQDQQPSYQIQLPGQPMLSEQTGQVPAPALQKEHIQSQILFPRSQQ